MNYVKIKRSAEIQADLRFLFIEDNKKRSLDTFGLLIHVNSSKDIIRFVVASEMATENDSWPMNLTAP